jgi:eukaryotic-like serine/threonine-protein kinase
MTCPSVAELRDLLADRLAGNDAEAVELHVESCGSCQRALEHLTSDAHPSNVDGLRSEGDRDSLVSSASVATWDGESGSVFLRRLGNTPPPANYSFPDTPEGRTAIGDSPPLGGSAVQRWPKLDGYEILNELGRGGMGVVYLAWQTKLNRPVAIKMILAGAQAGPEQFERFRREAEAVARLQHPNIVQIHEVGEQDGRPFFSLEYVDGVSLPQKLASTPQAATEAAELIHTLALAVHHAHQRGVVHRDLKPANVLLANGGEEQSRRHEAAEAHKTEPDSSKLQPPPSTRASSSSTLHAPIVKITDFGLAKRMDVDSGQTRSGEVIGTPSYMAPEQAAGKTQLIGPAVDVYALGAILYEVLTGRPPFKAETPMETVRQVVGEEPVRPTRLQRKIPHDLETICLHCLQKEPARRYATAMALADDLQRFLRGEPISARPTPVWEVALKWARRRPALAGLVVVSILALVSLAVGSLWYNAHLQAALQDAQVQTDKARDRFAMARDAVDQFHTRVSESPELKAKGTERLRTQLLETALAFYQRFVQEEGGVEVQAERGRAYHRLAMLYRETGRTDLAEDAFQHALSIFQSLVETHPEVPQFQRDLASGCQELALLYFASARTQEAETAMQRSVQLCKQLAESHPDDQKHQLALVACYRNFGSMYAQTGRPLLAESTIKNAQAVLRSLSSDDAQVKELSAQTSHALGALYHTTNRKEAEKAYQQALDLRKALAKTDPDSQADLIRSYRALGMLYVESDRYPQAEKSQSQALALCKRLADSHPTVPEYQKLLAGTYMELANVYLETGPYDKAETNYRQALEIQESLAAANPEVLENTTEMGATCGNLGLLMGKLGKPKAALEWFDKSIEALEAVLKREPRHSDAQHGLGFIYSERARAASELGRQREALANLDRSLQMESEEDKSRLRVRRARLLAYLQEHVRAVAEANELAQTGFAGGTAFYDLGCVYSVASAAARKDTRIPLSQREQLAGDYTRRATECLRKAKDAGLFKDQKWVENAKQDKDLDAIRSDVAFQNLLPKPRAALGPKQ